MRIGSRHTGRNEKTEVRTTSADNDSTASLARLIAILTAVLGGLLAGAVETGGWVRIVLVVLAVGVGLQWMVIVVPTIAVVGSLYLIRGVKHGHALPALVVVTIAVALLVGTVAGLTAYGYGPAALLDDPFLAAVVLAVTLPRVPARVGRRRTVVCCVLGGGLALAVSVAVFR